MDARALHGRPRPSVILCRRTPDHIPSSADFRYYAVVVVRYHRLPVYPQAVTTWGQLPHHDRYIRDFADAHHRKHRMWEIINTWKSR